MAYQWQTIEQAAVTLGISTRTLARRIAQGKVENRLRDGRREVFICLPDDAEAIPHDADGQVLADAALMEEEPEPAQPRYMPSDRHEQVVSRMGTVNSISGNTPVAPVPTLGTLSPRPTAPSVSAMGGPMSNSTALMVAEDRARRAELTLTVIQQSVNLMKNEATRARTGARWAWSMVALLAGGVIIAVGWTTSIVTRTGVTAEVLHDRVAEVRESEQKTTQRLERTEDELARANQARARAEGQLEEVRQQVLKAEEKAAAEAKRAEAMQAAARAIPATQPAVKGEHGTAGAVFGDRN